MFGAPLMMMGTDNWFMEFVVAGPTNSGATLTTHTITLTNPNPGRLGSYIVLGGTGSTNAGTARTVDSMTIDGNACTMMSAQPSARATSRIGFANNIAPGASFDVTITFSGSCAQVGCVVLYSNLPVSEYSSMASTSGATVASRSTTPNITASQSEPQHMIAICNFGNILTGSTVDCAWTNIPAIGYAIDANVPDSCHSAALKKYRTPVGDVTITATRDASWANNYTSIYSGVLKIRRSATYRYWRITVTALNDSGTRPGFYDVRFSDDGGSTLYPPNMTGNSAPSPYVASAGAVFATPTYDPFNAFDSDTATWWTSDGVSSSDNWLQLDLGAATPRKFNHLALKIRETGSALRTPNAFKIEGSDTGSFSGEQVVVYSVSGLAAVADGNTSTFNW